MLKRLGIRIVLGLCIFESTLVAGQTASLSHPCQKGVQVEVQLVAVNSSDGGASEAAPLVIDFRKNSRNPASSCQAWENKVWPHFKRMLFENQNANRSQMTCSHVAKVKYKIGANAKSVDLCIGDSSKDGVSYGFRKFYEGSQNKW